MALKIQSQGGRASVKFGAKATVIPVATRLHANPQQDKVEGVTIVGMNETTNRQKLYKK